MSHYYCPKCEKEWYSDQKCKGSWHRATYTMDGIEKHYVCPDCKPKRVQITYYSTDPPNTKRVSRPSRWGNPYTISEYPDLKKNFELYEKWVYNKLKDNPKFLEPLKGFNLGCFCKLTNPCHADVLLNILYGEKNKNE